MLRLIFGAGLCAGIALSTAGCGERLNETECNALLDRYVELLAVANDPESSHVTITRYQSEARKLAARDPEFADCPARVSRREFDCAMAAPTADRLEICLM